MTSQLGERRSHNTYDEIAAELKKAATRLAAPLALRVRQRALAAQRETRETERRLSERTVQASRDVGAER